MSKIGNLLIVFAAMVSPIFGLAQSKPIAVDSVMEQIQRHLINQLHRLKPEGLYPRTVTPENELVLRGSSDWTSGFLPGMLWYMFEYTGSTFWKKQAERWTAGLEFEKFNTNTHDVGFILFSSYGHGFRLTNRPHYKRVLLQGAKSLATRYDPEVGCTRSWEHGPWRFPVIIDNLMNLELLFWAARASDEQQYLHIARQHVITTMKNHYRPNGSAYHVVDYDPRSGRVLSRTNAQGYADESSWARGQSWGLYGFVMAYRETREKIFLTHAEKIASLFISRLPENYIPYWDFDAPNIPFEFQDASAASIAASALLELSQLSPVNGSRYFECAERMLQTLCSPGFFAEVGSNNNFLLKRNVGSMPSKKELGVPEIFSDYYLLEALMRYRLIINK